MTHITHITGIPHRKPDLSKLSVGQKLTLVAEPHNAFDPNAIKIMSDAVHLGYIPAKETVFFRDLPHVFIHSIQPQNKWREVIVGNELMEIPAETKIESLS